jgi:hypothetical protein
MINKPEGYTVAVDVAYSDDQLIDYKLMKAEGIDLVIVRFGEYRIDPLVHKHLSAALDAGMMVAGYWYAALDMNYQKQSDMFKSIAEKYHLRFIAPDIEQEEGSYTKIVKNKLKHFYGKYPQSIVKGNAWAFSEAVRKWCTCEFVEYTRTSYIEEFCPSLTSYFVQFPLWLAQYPWTVNKNGVLGEWVYTCDKQVAHDKGFTLCETWEEYFDKYAPKPDWKVNLPPKATEWKIWQFTGDHVHLPGSGSYIDINWVKSDWLFGAGHANDGNSLTGET